MDSLSCDLFHVTNAYIVQREKYLCSNENVLIRTNKIIETSVSNYSSGSNYSYNITVVESFFFVFVFILLFEFTSQTSTTLRCPFIPTRTNVNE